MPSRHDIRFTAEKIARRLDLIAPLVYRRRADLPPFRYRTLPDPDTPPPIGPNVDDGGWTTIQAGDLWGERRTNFVMRTQFRVPAGWDTDAPIALHLPLGEAGDFLHPEALANVNLPTCPHIAITCQPVHTSQHTELTQSRGGLSVQEFDITNEAGNLADQAWQQAEQEQAECEERVRNMLRELPRIDQLRLLLEVLIAAQDDGTL